MRFDLHVHSYFSPCGMQGLEQILAEARAAGLDGLAVTDHNSMEAARHFRQGRQEDGLIVLVGVEYDTPDGQFLLFGPVEGIPPGLGARKLLARVREAGGASVAAHPCRMIRPVSEYVLREGLCDAVEAVNGANSHAENMDACAAAKRYGLIEAGGSDAHAPGAVGRAWSEISRRVETAAELAEAIRDGRVRPAPPCP